MSQGETPRVSSADRVLARLGPHAHRARPVLGGMLLQIAGVGAPVAYLVVKSHHEDASGTLTFTTFRRAWHDALSSATGIALLAVCVVILLCGSALLAEAFVTTRRQLFLAVPVAALAGVLILGAIALAIVALLSAAESGSASDSGGAADDSGGGPGRIGGRKRRSHWAWKRNL